MQTNNERIFLAFHFTLHNFPTTCKKPRDLLTERERDYGGSAEKERGSESYRQRQRQQQLQHCADCDYRACQRGLNPARRELTSRRSNARARVAVSIRRYLSMHIVIYYTGIYVFIFKKTNSYYIVLSQNSVLSIYYPSLSHNPIQFQELTPGLRSRTRSRATATATATRASSPERTLSLECDSSTDLCSDRSDSHWIFENNHQFITQTRHCMCVSVCVYVSDTPPSYMYI